jgi:hypothetical protein
LLLSKQREQQAAVPSFFFGCSGISIATYKYRSVVLLIGLQSIFIHLNIFIMRGKLEKEGKYELFETTHGHEILVLNKKDYYAVVKTSQGHLLVKSDADHKKDHEVDSGKFYLADFEDDPAFKDMPHLFLKEGKKYQEFILPNDLPTDSDTQKKLIIEDDKIGKRKVERHVEGKGNRGDEKQYSGKPESLRQKTKKELYDMARNRHIDGRSEMNKEELVQAVSHTRNND